jgi:hypothetical protein
MTKKTSSGHSRSRRWLAERASRKTDRGRRIRTLFRGFMTKLTPGDPIHHAAAMTAAELTYAAETARLKLLDGDASAEEAMTRIENAARRAREDVIELLTVGIRKPKQATRFGVKPFWPEGPSPREQP